MIHLIGSYYMTAGKNAYTVGEVEESRTKRVFKPGARVRRRLEERKLTQVSQV